MSNRCPKCGFETSPNMQACPSCHTTLIENKKRGLSIKKIAIFVVVGFFGLAFLGFLLPDNKEKEQEVPWGIEELPEEENKEVANSGNNTAPVTTAVTTTSSTTTAETKPVANILSDAVISKLKDLKWNTKDMDIETNGNLKLAFKYFLGLNDTELEFIADNAQTIKPSLIRQAHWKYLGQTVIMTGEVVSIERFAPDSDYSKYYTGMKNTELSAIQLNVGDESNIFVFTTGDFNFDEGDEISFAGVVTSYISGTNAFGGDLMLPVFVSIW